MRMNLRHKKFAEMNPIERKMRVKQLWLKVRMFIALKKTMASI